MVGKKNGDLRPGGDYHALNQITVPENYPFPHIKDLSLQLNGKRLYSKLNLVWAHYQIPMAPDDIADTALITPFGLFENLRIPLVFATQPWHSNVSSTNYCMDYNSIMPTLMKSLWPAQMPKSTSSIYGKYFSVSSSKETPLTSGSSTMVRQKLIFSAIASRTTLFHLYRRRPIWMWISPLHNLSNASVDS